MKWSVTKAARWYARRPWPVGCNFLPSTAVNDVEMWQAATFDPKTIDRELGWAAGLGFNTVRVFLNYVVWAAQPAGFLRRLERFLAIATRHGISVMPILLDDCNFGHRDAAVGKQPNPIPGVHNSRWASSPPPAMVLDRAAWPELEKYVKAVVGAFADDERILIWDLYNEPMIGVKPNGRTSLVVEVFRWARRMKPSQPLTICLWSKGAERRSILERSDVISFHNYGPLDGMEKEVKSLRRRGRPLICTEWMARVIDSRFKTHLPFFKAAKVGCYCWGLVAGRTQTYFVWGSKKGSRRPKLWLHDILHKN
ncbi:unnamed protein product, partial [marine sediment metagenome]